MDEETDPNSILDTDLYKLTMHCAIWLTYPDAHVTYGFINRSRSDQPFSRSCFQSLSQKVERLRTRFLTIEEKDWLALNMAFFPSAYLDYLQSFRFKPAEHLRLDFRPTKDRPLSLSGETDEEYGDLEITIKGRWVDTILYEVPLLSMISEAYFETVDRQWTYSSQTERALAKATRLYEAGCSFSEFGTRRRRSWKTQLMVMEGIKRASTAERRFATSNVWMARRFGIPAVGTIAHEFIMAEGAMNGYKGANMRALDTWEACFPNSPDLWIALTDTFGTKTFFKELINDQSRAQRLNGLRQDSGDPKKFAIDSKKAWHTVGVDPITKRIVFSDGLDIDTCLELRRFCKEQDVNESYGIGTHFTNDFDKSTFSDSSPNNPSKSKPLNIVIKLFTVNDLPCVKLSDVLTKATGPSEAINHVRSVLGL